MSTDRRRRLERILLVVGAVLLLALGVRMVSKGLEFDNDASCYLSGAVAVVEKGDLYAKNNLPGHDARRYMYPPLLAVMLAPLAAVGLEVALVGWCLMCLLAVAGSCWLIASVAAGRSGAGRRWLGVVPFLLAARAFDSNFGNGEANTLVLLSFSLACYGMARRRDVLAGLATGFGIALKIVPVGLCAYYVMKRRWRALTATLIAATVFGLGLPVLAMGWRRTVESYESFRSILPWFTGRNERVNELTGGFGYLPGQSLRPMAHRYLRPTDASAHDRENYTVNVADLSYEAAEGVYRALAGLLCLLGLLLWTRRGELDDRRVLFDFAIAVLVLLLGAPYVRKAFHVLSVIPYAWVLASLPGRSALRVARGATAGLGAFLAYLLTVGLVGGGIPALPIVVVAITFTYLARRPSRDERLGCGLSLSVCLTLLSAPGLVGSGIARAMLAHSSFGLAAVYLFLAMAHGRDPQPPAGEGADIPSPSK